MALVVTRKYKINGVSKGRQNRKKSQWLNGSQMDSKLEKWQILDNILKIHLYLYSEINRTFKKISKENDFL